MSDNPESKVVMFDGADPQMQEAYAKARATFRYFWREIAWERRRIVPALDMACVKAQLSDGPRAGRKQDQPEVEHMWLEEIDFDGQLVYGTLLNQPNWIKTVKAGDLVKVPLDEINDWMYAIEGVVYGAFTVNLMRSRMNLRERKEHDAAWGLKFGDPQEFRLVMKPKKSSRAPKAAPSPGAELEEHPMSEAMAPGLKKQLAQDPEMARSTDERDWTLLHHQALAGSYDTVLALLEAGADVNAKTDNGVTPLRLAKSLGWEKVVELLSSHGAKR